MDGCVLLTSTPECVVSPQRAIPRAQPEGSPRSETTHKGVDVNNTHPSMINPLNKLNWTQPCFYFNLTQFPRTHAIEESAIL